MRSFKTMYLTNHESTYSIIQVWVLILSDHLSVMAERSSGTEGLESSPNKDFRYYTLENSDLSYEDGGAMITVWKGAEETFPLALGSPAVTRVALGGAAAQSTPAGGTYYLHDDTYYVVVSGNCTFCRAVNGDGVSSQGT